MLLALDWGTTSFRAYLFDSNRQIVDTISAPAGIMQDNDGFEAVYYTQVGNWLKQFENLPVIASGMITSKQGWVETPYLPCPASLEDLSKNLTRHETSQEDTIYFVSGVSQKKPTANIMRGEETQMAGLKSDSAITAVLPGTHSKWIRMELDTIEYFTTFMTGELFAAITEHTILGKLLTDNDDPAGFEQGVSEGFSTDMESGGILSKLFGARAMPLLGEMNPDSIKNYLSGLLLGTEIREAVNAGFAMNATPVICGSPELTRRYDTALGICGIKSRQGETDLAAQGLIRIAAKAGLLNN